MIKNIISSKHTDYSTFIQCDCGREILNFYYYKETATCEEIICVDYFGYLGKGKDAFDKQFTFTYKSLKQFIQDLIDSQKVKEFKMVYEDRKSYLVLKKNKLKFYTLSKYRNKKSFLIGKSVWDVTFRHSEMEELMGELKNLFNIVKENQIGLSPEEINFTYC